MKWTIPRDLANDDERCSSYQYITGKYQTTIPTDLQLRNEALKDLQTALYNITYTKELENSHEALPQGHQLS